MELVDLAKNPFKVFTPEGLTAKDVTDLFVPVQDFHKIKDFGHTMLNGPRGCGESMIFGSSGKWGGGTWFGAFPKSCFAACLSIQSVAEVVGTWKTPAIERGWQARDTEFSKRWRTNCEHWMRFT